LALKFSYFVNLNELRPKGGHYQPAKWQEKLATYEEKAAIESKYFNQKINFR
jgi:hypothetical protein